MDTSKICRQVIGIIILLIFPFSLWCKDLSEEVKKEINRSFPVKNGDKLDIDNRFGNITIEHWNRNEVKMQIVVESKANKQKTAQENLDKVSVDVGKENNRVYAVTSFKLQNQNNDTRVNVDYILLIPSFLNLDLKQEFGNITLPDGHKGNSSLNIKFGNIDGGDIKAPLSLRSQFGNVTLGNTGSVVLKAQHSGKITLGEINTLDAEIQFSNLKTGNVGSLQLDEKHSEASFEGLIDGKISAQHSKVKIGLVQTSLAVNTLSHSNLEIKELSSNFRSFAANANFGGVTICMNPRTSFTLSASTSFGKIDLQNAFKQKNRDYIEKNNKQSLTADINSGGNRIEFDGNFSTISIREL